MRSFGHEEGGGGGIHIILLLASTTRNMDTCLQGGYGLMRASFFRI